MCGRVIPSGGRARRPRRPVRGSSRNLCRRSSGRNLCWFGRCLPRSPLAGKEQKIRADAKHHHGHHCDGGNEPGSGPLGLRRRRIRHAICWRPLRLWGSALLRRPCFAAFRAKGRTLRDLCAATRTKPRRNRRRFHHSPATSDAELSVLRQFRSAIRAEVRPSRDRGRQIIHGVSSCQPALIPMYQQLGVVTAPSHGKGDNRGGSGRRRTTSSRQTLPRSERGQLETADVVSHRFPRALQEGAQQPNRHRPALS